MNLADLRHSAARLPSAWMVAILRRTGVTPNMLTIIGLLGSFAAGALIGLEYVLWGGIVVLLAAAFDLFDGPLARETNRVTKFGAVLDSTSDRLSEAAVLFGVLILYLQRDAFWEPVLVYLTLLGSVMVSYIRARAEGLDLKCEVGLFTRAERVIIIAAGLIFAHWFDMAILVTLSVLAAFSFLTAFDRLMHIKRSTK